jgi:2'-5' RNA ligase
MPRLFVGTFLAPDQQERLAQLASEDEKLGGLWHRKLRWVKPKKLHLTWYFLGTVEDPAIPAIKERLLEAVSELPGSALRYDTLEIWPSAKMPRQFVLTPSVVPDEVNNIVGNVRTSLKGLVPDPDYKTFKPHITLMRFDRLPANRPKGSPVNIPADFPPPEILPIEHRIASVCLIQSHLGGAADEYESIQTIELKN